MKAKHTLFLLFAALVFFSFTNVSAESEPSKLTTELVTIDYYPQTQFMENGLDVVEPSIQFAGIEIPTKFKKEKLEIKIGGTSRKLKPDQIKILELKKGDEILPIGFVRYKGTWKYFNARILKLTSKSEKFEIYSVDMDCDGKYLVPNRDGLLYPGCNVIVPFEGIKIWYLGKMVDLVTVQDGFNISTEPIKGTKAEIEMLTGFNIMRVGAGLHGLKMDADKSEKCRKHANYIVANGGEVIPSPYDETLGNEGYTAEGKSIAASSLYWYFETAPGVAAHLGYIFYRNRYIHGSSRDIAIGIAESIHVINAANIGDKPINYNYPIMFPGPGQTIPYTHFSNHAATFNPDPRPGQTGCGFPATLSWDFNEHIEIIDAKFLKVKGVQEVAQQVAVSGPNKPCTEFYKNNMGMIALIPLNPLEPKSSYRVVVKYKQGGEEKIADWIFHTTK